MPCSVKFVIQVAMTRPEVSMSEMDEKNDTDVFCQKNREIPLKKIEHFCFYVVPS